MVCRIRLLRSNHLDPRDHENDIPQVPLVNRKKVCVHDHHSTPLFAVYGYRRAMHIWPFPSVQSHRRLKAQRLRIHCIANCCSLPSLSCLVCH
ncbi:hypothetical protein GDO78_008577 [Eleutherodactylus coqui]|uniref:Uncharacterized protein n=1 Tax=Eleutherodactylus coqui TaxID=57060 RepID=A0A8J6KBF0_ELECQ|nr:hypothetical protein GDO78_008577 [Eleutherodactylus coqui]